IDETEDSLCAALCSILQAGGVVETADVHLAESARDRARQMADFIVDQVPVRHVRRWIFRPHFGYHGGGAFARDELLPRTLASRWRIFISASLSGEI
ncbi:hypothetical protein ACLKMY_30275, partial [Paraburkholderia mimosarum]|uniref:hypothetical protein n=1 Tax=Paraburkholderia mimosarum TaxID=312026 RepID=UPI0039C4253E